MLKNSTDRARVRKTVNLPKAEESVMVGGTRACYVRSTAQAAHMPVSVDLPTTLQVACLVLSLVSR